MKYLFDAARRVQSLWCRQARLAGAARQMKGKELELWLPSALLDLLTADLFNGPEEPRHGGPWEAETKGAMARALAACTRGPIKATVRSPPNFGHLPEMVLSPSPVTAPSPLLSLCVGGGYTQVAWPCLLPGVSSLEARGKCISVQPMPVTALEGCQGQEAGVLWMRAHWVPGRYHMRCPRGGNR